MWVEREAGKAAGQRGGVSSDVVRAEATEFALQLAVHLTSKSQVMLFDAKHSQLFAEGSSADVFFGKDDLTRSARAAAPLRFSADGAVLSFIHKTVQEHLTARALLQGVAEAVDDTQLNPAGLLKTLGDTSAAPSSTEARRRTATLRQFLRPVLASPLGQVDLGHESGVRDFLADKLVEDLAGRLRRASTARRAAAACSGS